MKAMKYLKLLRPTHWLKNTYILLPYFLSGNLSKIIDLNLLFCIIVFSLTSSIIYIMNDLIDKKKDQLHQIKCKRIIASGLISKKNACFICGMLLLILILLICLSKIKCFYIYIYFILNLLYIFILKQFAIIDVICISCGFVLRVLEGGIIGNIIITNWTIILVFLLSCTLALFKRLDDFKYGQTAKFVRVSNNGYNIDFIKILSTITATIALNSYIYFTLDPNVILKFKRSNLLISNLFVFVGIARYIQLSIVFNKTESPVKVLLKDIYIQIAIISWILYFLYITYL